MEFAWHVGLVTLVMVGVFKTILSPLGNAVRELVPRAGLLGSLAAIALTLIAFLPLLLDGIAAVPVVGMLALVVVLVTLVAHRELPGASPGRWGPWCWGPASTGCATSWGERRAPAWSRRRTPREAAQLWRPASLLSFYGSGADWWREVVDYAVGRLPVALPFALATIVGGIDCTESAAAAGDVYDTRTILLTEGVGVAGRRLARRRDPDDALHRPSRLQEDGRRGGLHAGQRPCSSASSAAWAASPTCPPICRRRRCFPSSSSSAWRSRRNRSTPRRRSTIPPWRWRCCRPWRT